MAADLLTENDRLDQAETETAVGLGQLHRQPALLGHGRPQEVVELAGLVGHLPHPGDKALVVEEGRRRVLQRPLVV